MLKKVLVSQLVVGMYVQELGGTWMDHGFWRSKFLISNDHKLNKIKKSRLDWVIINTERGIDVEPEKPVKNEIEPQKPEPSPEEQERVREQQAFDDAREIVDGAREQVTNMFADARAGGRADLNLVENLIQDMSDSLEGHPDALTSLTRIKRADQYTYMHSVSVAALMTALARTMKLSEENVRLAGMSGLLHDIGKVQIPDEILNKSGRLTDVEYSVMKTHPVLGADMLKEDPDVPPAVIDVCLHHHEKVDGDGYPDRLSGKQISLFARMGAICDVYDAVTSNRPYKKGWDPAFTIHKMLKWEGHFDKAVLQAFIRTVGRYPLGSIISLNKGELGLVVAQNKDTPDLPVVKVFYSVRWSHAIPIRKVNLADPDCETKILPVVAPVDWSQSGLPVPPILDTPKQ